MPEGHWYPLGVHTSLLFRTNVTRCSKSTQSLISEWNYVIACWKHGLTQQLTLGSDTVRNATNHFAILCHSPKFVAVQHIWKDLCELKWENLVQNFPWRIKKFWIRFRGFHTVNLFTAFCDNWQRIHHSWSLSMINLPWGQPFWGDFAKSFARWT